MAGSTKVGAFGVISLCDSAGDALNVGASPGTTRTQPLYLALVDSNGYVLDNTGTPTATQVSEWQYNALCDTNGNLTVPGNVSKVSGFRYVCLVDNTGTVFTSGAGPSATKVSGFQYTALVDGNGNVVAYGGGGGETGTYDPALPTPYLELNTATPTTYPPSFLASIEEGTLAGDQLEMPAATSYANLIAGTLVNSAQKIQTITGSPLDFGLSAITTPAKTYAYVRLRRGTTYGPWSNVVGHGSTDRTPDAFVFTDNSSAPASTIIESNSITVAGLGLLADVSITGGEYAINTGAGFGSWTSAAGYIENGNIIKVRHTSSSDGSAVNTTLTIGGVSDTFTSTNLAASRWNSADKDAALILSNNDLTATGPSSVSYKGVRSLTSLAPDSGKFCWELNVDSFSVEFSMGVATSAFSMSADPRLAATATVITNNGSFYTLSSYDGSHAGGNLQTAGTKVMIAVDTASGVRKIWFARNGTWDGNPAAGTDGHTLPTGTVLPLYVTRHTDGATLNLNPSGKPSGFNNLP